MLKVIAFAPLTTGFFIAQSMSGIQVRSLDLVEAWEGQQVKNTSLAKLNNSIVPVPVLDFLDWGGAGYVLQWQPSQDLHGLERTMLVYVALFYATFFYRWPGSELPWG